MRKIKLKELIVNDYIAPRCLNEHQSRQFRYCLAKHTLKLLRRNNDHNKQLINCRFRIIDFYIKSYSDRQHECFIGYYEKQRVITFNYMFDAIQVNLIILNEVLNV